MNSQARPGRGAGARVLAGRHRDLDLILASEAGMMTGYEFFESIVSLGYM